MDNKKVVIIGGSERIGQAILQQARKANLDIVLFDERSHYTVGDPYEFAINELIKLEEYDLSCIDNTSRKGMRQRKGDQPIQHGPQSRKKYRK